MIEARKITPESAADIVARRVTDPENFIEVLNTVPAETWDAVLGYIATLPEVGNEQEQTNPSEEV